MKDDQTSVLLRELANNLSPLLHHLISNAEKKGDELGCHLSRSACHRLNRWLTVRAPLLPGHEHGWNIESDGQDALRWRGGE